MQRASDGKPWCTEALVPFYIDSRLAGCYDDSSYDLVEITCYYNGGPVAYGDNYEDHVDAVNRGIGEGNHGISGHFPDFFVDLGGNNPPNVGIHYCAS